MLPSVFVDKLSASVRGGTLEGDFTVLSEVKDVIGNLQYRIEIYGDLPGQPTADPQILFAVSKTFDITPLVPGERRVMDFSYALPNLPEGTFTARIQVLHGGTRELGWANARIELPRTASTFLTAYGESISLPEFEGKGVGALTGPNVDPEAEFSVTLGVFNAGGAEAVVVPRFTVHRMDMSAPSLSETGFDPLSIPSTDSTITLQVKAPKTPGVYVGALTLEQNGKTVSTIGQYRFVVRGLDADIISARLANVASLKGETAFVRIDMVGPADAETTGKAFMQVSIRDADGIAGQVTVSDLTLNDGVGMGMAKVTLTRDLGSSPDIYVVIKDTDGNVLTESTTSIGLTTAQLEAQSEVSTTKLWAVWYTSPSVVVSVLLGLLAILALAVILYKIVSLRRIPVALQHALSGAMIVMLIVTQFSPVFAYGGSNGLEVAAPRTLAENLPFQSGDPAAYTTYWSQIWNRPIVALFINRPIHNSTVDCRQPIPLEFRVEYAACNNIPAAGRVIARFDANGNHQTTLMGTNANWIKVFEDVYVQVPFCAGGARACIHTKSYNTTVNLGGLAPNATKTTLQVVVKHNAYIDASHGVPDDTISTSDVYFQRRFAQAFNLHLNCSAICGNGAVETGEQCDDGNQNPNDACNNQCQLTRCGDGIVQNPNGNGQNEECDDGNTNNNDACSNSCQIQAPDVEITKTSSVQSVPQGGTFNYVLTARNNGPIAATNVVVTDQIPSTLTITSVPSGCTANGNTLTCNIGNLAVNATRTFTVGVSVPTNHVCPAQLNNTGVITATGDTNAQNNQSTAQTAVTCVTTDIQITKTAPATLANDNASSFNYTLVVQNNSGTPAQNVVVNDMIPQPLTITSVPSGCTANGNALQCTVGTLAGNATRTFTVGVQAPARSVCAQTVTNTASVTTTTQDTNSQNNQSSAQTNFTCQTDIRIVKTGPATINNDAAGSFNYVFTVTNLTATPALNVVVSDVIPAPINVSAVPGGCTYNAGTLQCNLGTLAGNATVTITVPVNIGARAACGQSIPNTARVQTSTPDTNAQNNESTISTQFTCTPPTDIEVVKTAPATLSNDAVSNFNYVITLRNLTTSTAQNVSLSDNIPQPLTITSVPAGCNANGNVINCPVGALGANATRTFTVGVSAPARSVCSQTLTNTASATTSTIETNQNNNQSSAQTNFTCTPQTDISITKTAPATLNNDAASPFNYTLTVTNTTSTPAANVVITDNVPAQLTITSLPAGCARTNNAVTCTVGTLAGNQSRQFVFGVSAAARTVCSQTLTNTANVTTTTQDTNNQNNQDSAQTAFTCTPITDIQVTKTAPASINNDAVSPFSYTITVQNLTANAAANVVITDNVPAQLTITSLPAGCARTNNAVTCTVGTLAGNASRQFVFGVSVPARAVCGQTLSNTANVTTSSPESSTQNNQDTAQTAFTCTPQTDVTISKTAPTSLSNDAASPFNYTLTVTNNTSVSAANVVITDTIPQPLTVMSVPAGCSANGNTVTCSVGTLAANASRQYVIGVSAPARSVCAQTVTNTAFVSTTSLETNVNNNQASAQTSFTCTALQTDVRIVKTAPATLSNDAVSPFDYTITVTNLTTTAAANVVITDNVPAQLTITSLPAGCARTNNAVTCTVGTLGGNQSRQFVFGVSTAARTACSQTLTNTANVTTTTPENNTTNNQSSAQTNFTCTAQQTDVTITKTAPGTLSNNTVSNFNYTLTVTNTTSVSAANVVITDAIPAQLSITSLPAGCTSNGNAVTCNVGTLAANASRQYVIGVSAPAGYVCSQIVTNTAYVTTTTPETNPNNNQASAQTNFTCSPPDFSVTKLGPAVISPGEILTYLVTVTNNGPTSQTNVRVVDQIPSGLTFTSNGSTPGCAQSGNSVVCPVQTYQPGQSVSYTLKFTANQNIPCNSTVINSAVVQQNSATLAISNQWLTTVQCTIPKLDITKSVASTVISGGTAVYTFVLRNTSTTQTATEVELYDFYIDAQANPLLNPTFTFVSISLGSCDPLDNQGRMHCNLPNLAPNQVVTFTMTFNVPTNQNLCGQTVINQVDVWTQHDEANADWDKAQTVVQCAVTDVTVTKTAPATLSNDTVSNFNYTLTATNTTAVSALNVVITDAIPATLTITSLPAGCTANGNAITCNVGTLAGNQSRQYVIGVSAVARSVCGQSVPNYAYITTTSTETNPNNNRGYAHTNFTCTTQTDVTVTKTAPTTLTNDAASPFNYTLTVTNNTSVAADNVVITDTIPQPLTVTSVPAGCSANGNTVTCSAGTLAANASRQYIIGVSAAARALCAQSVTNYAYVTTTTQETNVNNNQASAQTAFTCTQQTDISITKTAPPSLTNDAATPFNYTLTVTNNTSVAADNVVITDTIPATLTVTSVPAGCTANGNAITCNAGTLAGNQSRQYVIGVSAAARAVCSQTITNTASVTTSTFDTNNNNNSSSAQTTFTCTQQNPRLYITKAGPATVNAGSTITYSFTLQNTSAFTATNVNVYDYFIDQNFQKLLPAPFTFVSSNGLTCQYDATDQRVECNPVDLTAQQMITFTMTFNVPTTQALCGQTVTNKGETISGTNQQTLDSDIAATTVMCQTPPQFTLVKSGPASVSPGELLTYIITATNTGPTVQNNIQMYDDVPPGLTFEPNGSTPGCVENNAHVYCAAQTFQPGQSVSYTLKFRANQNIPCNSDIINEAELEQNGTVFKYSNQTHTAVQCTAPRLDITKSAPATIGINGTITYSFSLRNTSATQTATQVELYDFNVDAQANPLMPYFTFQSISLGSCDPVDNQGRIHCDLPNLAPSQVVNFTMTFSVPNNQNLCGLTIINQVDVWTQNDEANADWDKAQTVVQCAPTTADVSIVKSGPASANRGSNITYSLVVSNAGPATATNVVTHDQIPAGLTFVSATGATCSPVNGSIDCTIGSLVVGAPQTILLHFTTPAAPPSCMPGSVQNVATVTAQTTDPNMTNNSSQTFTSLTCPQASTADISVVKTGPATVVRGNQIAYTIFVSNSGPSTATGVSITDIIPAGFTYVSATGATCAVTGNQSQVGCTIGTLAAGASANIVLTFTTPVMAQNCTQTTATNVVSVTSITIDPNLNNNSSSATTTLTCPQDTSADVAVLKFGPSTVVRGNQITYSLIVTNYGPGTAQGITLSDPIPQGLTFVSSSGGQCSVVANVLTCTIGTLPSGQSSPIISATFLAPTIQACTASSVTNTATITATTPDSQLGNNSASVATAITCPAADTADLSIVKTGTLTAQYGAQVTYSLTVTNGGPSSVNNVTVSDTFPPELTYVSVTGATCQLALPANSPTIGGILSCDVGTLASGASKNIQFIFSTAVPAQCAQTTVINNASVTENDPNVTDPNSTNNQSSAATILTCASSTSDLSIVKTGPATVARGNNITYTLNVTNTSTATVSNTYTVTDAVPTGLTFVPTGSSANCTLQGANVVCTGSIAPAQTIPLTLIFSVPTIANCTQSVVTNLATVAGQLTDPVLGNNTSPPVTTILTCPTLTTDFSITKTGPSTVVRGSTVTYTIVATNNGPSTATNVVVTDAFSSEYTYLSASGATCAVSGNVLTCTIGTMTSSQSVTITAIFTAKTSSGTCSTATVTNTATITSDTADSNTANNTSSAVTTQLTCATAEISVYKTDNRSTANVLDRLRYSIIITNNSSTVANNLLVTDSVPYGLTILTVSDGGTVNGQQVRWTDISVPANSSRTLYIDTEVRSDVGNGTIVRNTVDVNGKTATDETTIYNNTYVNPPPPPYYPPNPPPPYYPPNPPPPYYPPNPNPPPVYYPPNPPPVIYPQTGDKAVDLFAAKIDTASVTPVTPKAAEEDNGFSAVFYATLIALLAVGSAAATRFISFGL